MPFTETRLLQLIANAEENRYPEDVRYWRGILDDLRAEKRGAQ